MRKLPATESGAGRKVTVLGIGNRLMGDDGIGNYIAEELERLCVFPDLRIEEGETDTEFCLDVLEDTENVILIDAAHAGGEPGTVSVFPLGNDLFRSLPSSAFPHNFSLLHAMKVHRYEKEGLLIAIEAASVTYRLGLSSELEEKFSRIVDIVSRQIAGYLNRKLQ